MNLVPTVIEKSNNSERVYDIYSRLLKDRIIILSGEIDDSSSNIVVAELLYLDSINHNDISIYINSPGGSVTAGMAIYDTMNFIKSDVSTICVGMAASMGAFLLSSGQVGKRFSLENSEIMIHQPLGGVQGQATEIKIAAERILKYAKLLKYLNNNNITEVNYTAPDIVEDEDEDDDNNLNGNKILKKIK